MKLTQSIKWTVRGCPSSLVSLHLSLPPPAPPPSLDAAHLETSLIFGTEGITERLVTGSSRTRHDEPRVATARTKTFLKRAKPHIIAPVRMFTKCFCIESVLYIMSSLQNVPSVTFAGSQ